MLHLTIATPGECVDCSDVALALLRVAEEWQDASSRMFGERREESSAAEARPKKALVAPRWWISRRGGQPAGSPRSALRSIFWEWDDARGALPLRHQRSDLDDGRRAQGFSHRARRGRGDRALHLPTTNEAYRHRGRARAIPARRGHLRDALEATHHSPLPQGKPVPLEALPRLSSLPSPPGSRGWPTEPLPGMG